ncbi:MAG: hypothetical protein ACUVQZ_08705 [Candidatus Caldatribacteriaceae bacterium]
MLSDTKRKSNEEMTRSLKEKLQKDFAIFYLFHEVFSEPVCRRIHPLFRFSLQRGMLRHSKRS